MNSELLWISPFFMIPPLMNCIWTTLTLNPGNETYPFSPLPNISVHVRDFGGDESVKFVVNSDFGHWVESLSSLLDYYTSKGYTLRKDLFACPYDWRVAPFGMESFFNQLTSLIESAFENNQQKVSLIGYSCGAFILHKYLHEVVSSEWKFKYIDRIILLTPSFGGTGIVVASLWLKTFPFLKFYSSKKLARMFDSFPTGWAHFPNHHVYKDTFIARSEFDQLIGADQLADLFIEQKKILPEYIPLLRKAENLSKQLLRQFDLPTYVIYNSGIDTDFQMHFTKGYAYPPEMRKWPGDGSVPSKGAEWICQNWTTEKSPIICLDLFRNSPQFEHVALISNPVVHDLLYKTSTGMKWIKTSGKKIWRAPYYQVLANITQFEVRHDIRPKQNISHLY